MTALESINVPQAAKLRVQDFELLHNAGVFSEYVKSELIEGEIWVMNAVWTAHAKAQSRLIHAITESLKSIDSTLETYANLSIDLSDDSMPEPDIVVAEDHNEGAMPLSKVKLVIEISDSTLDIDLGRKATLYANAGILEYWVADVNGRVIHQMWMPGVGGYGERRMVVFGDAALAETVVGLRVDTGGLG